MKIFKCPFDDCKQEYYYRRNLNSHIRQRHKDIRFQCELCPRKLSTKQKLAEHVSKIHENPVQRNPPPVKEYRRVRRDIGVEKKSALSKLCGLKLQPAIEKLLRNRHNEEEKE